MSARILCLGALLIFVGGSSFDSGAPEVMQFQDPFQRGVELAHSGRWSVAARHFESLARSDHEDAWQADFNAAWCRVAEAEDRMDRGEAEAVIFELTRARESLVEALRQHQEPWLRESLEAVTRKLRMVTASADSSEGARTGSDSPGHAGTPDNATDEATSQAGSVADTEGSAGSDGNDRVRSAREVEAVLEEILAEMRRRESVRRLPRARTGESAW